MKKDKAIDLGALGDTPEKIKNAVKNGTPVGKFSQILYEEFPKYDHPTGDSFVWRGNNNADIIIGRDRNAGYASGYAGRGMTQAGAIDLVAGRLSSVQNSHLSFPGISKKEMSLKIKRNPARSSGVETGPNFAADAARVYITQRGNIDSYFALFLGNTRIPSTENRSAVGIKADHTRIIGRESVKIYAGKGAWNGGSRLFGEKHSRGGTIETSPVIELVAGNYQDIQPAVKGDNLHKCLREIFEMIKGLYDISYNQYALFIKMCSHMMGHQHPVVGLGGGIALIDPSMFSMSLEVFIKALCGQIDTQLKNLTAVINEVGALGVGPKDNIRIPGWDDILSANIYLT
jgi:hypothetical protein